MVSLVPPGSGLEQTKDRDPTPVIPPAGTAAAECPEGVEPPAGKPLRPRFPKEPHHRRAADASLYGTRPQSSSVRHGHGPGLSKGGFADTMLV